ncbi:MAG: methionyl-tRNA formyltransferase [Candidatus Omnitrophica bacterium]|nr:methionyl-tRNA formyltransferase [Candidatus Omnitrophota bacterium]
MKVVFFGTSEFAIGALEALIGSRHEVLAVVTQPDRQKGRHLHLSPSPTKVLAQTQDIPVYQPKDASSNESVEYLKTLGADLFVVVSFGQILKKEALSIPKHYAINLHGSLLPKYRGAAPTNWAVINGDKTTGVTIIRMNEKMDEGDIMLKSEIDIAGDDTNITISEKLSDLGAKALLKAIESIEKDKAKFKKQDASAATYAPKLKKEDGLINWDEPATTIHNKVRGLLPWPGAYTHYDGKILKILKTEISDIPPIKDIQNGEMVDIVKDKGMIVKTAQGNLAIQYLQIEGKKDMDFSSFLRGHRIPIGYIFK